VITATVPLLLASAGLLITFAAGLWNIGVEGQIVAGALLATWLAMNLTLPPALFIPLLLLAGLVGGALWGLLAGWLKVYGGVHEIFGGVGLNFIAIVLTNYLIFGPWKPADGATMSGTDPFPPAAWLPRLGDLPVHPIAVVLALVAVAAVYLVLRGTTWGLKLKAIGNNQRSAFLMGIPTHRYLLGAFLLCGALAGLVGAIQAIGVRQRLIPGVSGGYGFLALLVVLLAGYRPLWVIPIALFFAAVGVGSPRLELNMQLDSALGGTMEALIVLFVLLAQGVRKRRTQTTEPEAAVQRTADGAGGA
jgi:simple sugar transport system permease protein